MMGSILLQGLGSTCGRNVKMKPESLKSLDLHSLPNASDLCSWKTMWMNCIYKIDMNWYRYCIHTSNFCPRKYDVDKISYSCSFFLKLGKCHKSHSMCRAHCYIIGQLNWLLYVSFNICFCFWYLSENTIINILT